MMGRRVLVKILIILGVSGALLSWCGQAVPLLACCQGPSPGCSHCTGGYNPNSESRRCWKSAGWCRETCGTCGSHCDCEGSSNECEYGWERWVCCGNWGTTISHPGCSQANGLEGKYYRCDNVWDPACFSAANLKMVRNDSQINFDWGNNSPDSGCGNGESCRLMCDNFSVEWTGYINIPKDGTWTFYTLVDDGAEVRIETSPGNWTTVINKITRGGGAYEFSGSRYLVAGWHGIRVRFHEYVGPASMRLYFSGPGTTKRVIPSSNLRTCEPPPTIDLTCQFTDIHGGELLGDGSAGNPYQIQRGTDWVDVLSTGSPDPGGGSMDFSVIYPSGLESSIGTSGYSGGGGIVVNGANCTSHDGCATCGGSYCQNSWVNYSVNLPTAGEYHMRVHLKHDAGCQSDQLFYRFRFDGGALPSQFATKGDNSWEWVTINLGDRSAGHHTFGFALGHDCCSDCHLPPHLRNPDNDLNAYVDEFRFAGGSGVANWELHWDETYAAKLAALPENDGYRVKARFNGTGTYAPSEAYCWFDIIPPANAEYIISASKDINACSFCWGQDVGCLLSYYPEGYVVAQNTPIRLPDYEELLGRFGGGARAWGSGGSFPTESGVWRRQGNITRNTAFYFPDGRAIVLFIDGTLTVNGNISIPQNSAVVFIARDGIRFRSNLAGGNPDYADGIYISEGDIDTAYNYSGGNTPQLVMEGALISTRGVVDLNRHLSDVDSAQDASEEIHLPAKYLVLMSDYLGEAQLTLREVAP